MSKDLKSLFPNASKSTENRNPHLSGSTLTTAVFTHVTADDIAEQAKKEEAAANAFPLQVTVQKRTDESKLNKLERAWLGEMRRRGYSEIGIQDITLKLGDDCRYTPDFSAVVDGALTLFEIKGFFRDDAKVKLKVAARQYRIFRFVLVTRAKKNLGGAWKEEAVKP